MGGAHLFQNGLGVAEHLPAGGQLLFLLRLQRGRLDLVHLETKQFQPALLLLFVHLKGVCLPLDGDQLTVDLPVCGVFLLVLRIQVQQRQMAGGIGQVLVVVLAVDVDEAGGKVPKHGRGGRHAVDPAVALALGAYLTIEQ